MEFPKAFVDIYKGIELVLSFFRTVWPILK